MKPEPKYQLLICKENNKIFTKMIPLGENVPNILLRIACTETTKRKATYFADKILKGYIGILIFHEENKKIIWDEYRDLRDVDPEIKNKSKTYTFLYENISFDSYLNAMERALWTLDRLKKGELNGNPEITNKKV